MIQSLRKFMSAQLISITNLSLPGPTQPVLSAMGRHIALIGPGSAGIAAKLTNNALLAMNAVTGCEGLRLSELLGISKSEDFLTLMEVRNS